MTLVLQNFYHPLTIDKVTSKIRIFFLARNIEIFVTLLHLNWYLNMLWHLQYLTHVIKDTEELWLNFGIKVFKNLTIIKKVFWRYNLVLSFKYWIFKRALDLPNTLSLPHPQLTLKTKSHLNLYYYPAIVSNVGFKGQIYRLALLTLLHFTLMRWPKLNKNFVFTMNFFYIQNLFFLCTFFNTRIFKVYYF